MKAKKNLFEAPATKVLPLVEEFIYDTELIMTEEDGTLHPESFDAVFEVMNSFQIWRMPKEIVRRSILEGLEGDDLEEEIIDYVTAEYHKSLAA